MFPRPIAIGMILCDLVIIEKGSEKASLIGQFQRFRIASFPGLATPFCIYAMLTGAEGRCTIELEIQNLRTLDIINTHSQAIDFSDRLAQVRVLFRLNQCVFPEPGFYQAKLLADREWVAQQRIEVNHRY